MSQPRRQDKKVIQSLFSGFSVAYWGLRFIPHPDAKKPAGKDEKPAGLLQLVARGAKRYAIQATLRRANPSAMIVTPEKDTR